MDRQAGTLIRGHNLPPNNVVNLNHISWVGKEEKWCMKNAKEVQSSFEYKSNAFIICNDGVKGY